MGSPYNPYWFPECLICGGGNLGTVICLNSKCHRDHGLHEIDDYCGKEHQADGHYWN